MIEILAFTAGASVAVAAWLALERRQKPPECVSDAARVMCRQRAAKAASDRRAAVVAHIESFGDAASPRVARIRPEFLADAEGRN